MNNKILKINLIIYFVYSIGGIYFSSFILNKYNNYYLKQILFYIVGLLTYLIVKRIKLSWIFKNIKYFYIINVILLIFVLFFGTSINGSKSWFKGSFLSFQPSEFMKVILVIYLSVIINDKKNNELKRFIKCLIITAIPSILTFIAPDTGIVICYIISLIFILFGSKIKIKWFIILTIGLIGSLGLLIYLIIYNNQILIDVFGNDIIYRINRLLGYDNYQINNALIGIGSCGLFSRFDIKYIIYLIEAPTDFIFATIGTYSGLIITSMLVLNIFVFDNLIINRIKHSNRIGLSYIYGFLGVLIYHQIEHIFMNIGLFPITGITLPFVSYGGSSLLSGMIILSLIFHD